MCYSCSYFSWYITNISTTVLSDLLQMSFVVISNFQGFLKQSLYLIFRGRLFSFLCSSVNFLSYLFHSCNIAFLFMKFWPRNWTHDCQIEVFFFLLAIVSLNNSETIFKSFRYVILFASGARACIFFWFCFVFCSLDDDKMRKLEWDL